MFAGLPELFVILVVVFAAWHVVKKFNQMRPPEPSSRPRQDARWQAQPMIEAEDLVSCGVCGTYVAASARHCGRAGCPQPR